MPVHYSLPGVELNLMTPGLPHGYRGPVIKGSDQSHITDNFGETVNQSVTTGKASINLQYKKWHAGTEMICHHEFLPGMFTRILLHERQKEKIMGVGKVTLEAGQFYSLLGSRFTTIMAHEQATESCNLGLWWSVNFIREIIPEYPALRREIRAILEDIPRKMIAPPLSLTDDMQSMINELLEFDYTEPGAQKLLHGKM